MHHLKKDMQTTKGKKALVNIKEAGTPLRQ